MPNPFAHIELTTDDLKAAQKFYGKIFGWKLTENSLRLSLPAALWITRTQVIENPFPCGAIFARMSRGAISPPVSETAVPTHSP